MRHCLMQVKLFERDIFACIEKYKVVLVYLVSLAYIFLNAYMVYKDFYWSLFIPLALVILYFYFTRIDIILLLIAFTTPLAVNFVEYDLGAGLSLPSEPLLLGVLIIFILKILFEKKVDSRIWTHPVSIILILQLIWIFITAMTSQIPLVSFKFLLSRLWFVFPFYFMGIFLFRRTVNIYRFIWLYTIPLTGVIFYTVYHHAQAGFDEEIGHWIMSPFYNDHTAYGAAPSLFIPPFVAFTFSRRYKALYRLISMIVLIVLLVALYLSFCRAAWISISLSLIVFLIIIFRIRFKWIAVTMVALVIGFMLFQQQLWDVLEKNKQGTSGNFIEHIQSISNISTDDSNLERINRWQSALRMFNERPVFGFGPGTYQFEYAPYQLSQEKTLISTNAGDMGNAHSEYIGPLAEQGFLGMVLMVVLVIIVLIYGFRIYYRSPDPEIRLLSLAIILGLIAYFFHGILNNFLDTDKASVPIWAFIGMLVSMNVFPRKVDGNGNRGESDV
jgi:O-antigen ligase